MSQALERIRKVVRARKKERFAALSGGTKGKAGLVSSGLPAGAGVSPVPFAGKAR